MHAGDPPPVTPLETVHNEKGKLWLGIKDSIAGTISGAACLFTGHPFDTIKVRMQTQSGGEGAVSTLSRTVKNEGVFALYKGVTSPLVGMMFETAVLFVAYGQIKAVMQKDPTIPLTVPQMSVAGGIAGCFTSFVLTPIELAKCRLQIQTGKMGDTTGQKYKSPLHCLMVTAKEEGIRGIFRGFGPTLAREAPGNLAFFGVYEGMKRTLVPEGKTVNDLGLGSLVLSGGLGGVAYWSIFYPADVAKSKIQTMDKPIGFATCLKQIYRNEGWKGLYRGYLPTVLRAFPANAVMFSSYELIFRLLTKFE